MNPINRFKLYKAAPEIYEHCKLAAQAMQTALGILTKSEFKPNEYDIDALITILNTNARLIADLAKSIEGKEIIE